ncbi:LuxR C-terminal-related transcriptional regulator [Paenibacillus sp. FSL K6-1096]|uniref:LuxR C-terminal-related transcriptional regulator n=1 Tax=Paenibacillus sp. FSL K6-1096 TaxID=2921460 RepID=UPI0030EDF8CA
MNPNDQDIPLLRSKWTTPRQRDEYIARRRLLDELEDSANGRLTVVSAPAGSGKTTLLSQWARHTGRAVAWVSLDPLDNDPIRFWRYIAAALGEQSTPAVVARLTSAVAALPHRSLYAFVDALMNEWYCLSRPVTLILDDYHLITEQVIHDSLAYAISYLPEQAHLMIGSRAELPFPTGRWLAGGEMRIITFERLRFSVQETRDFYNRTHSLPLTDEQVDRLHLATEGWVTGLQLAAVSQTDWQNHASRIDRLDGSHRAIVDYLFQEVYSTLTEAEQHFLCRTAVLERMDAGLCAAVSGEPGSGQMLQRLEAANLFVIPLDTQGNWYRYHPLFGEFLRTLLRQQHPQALRAAHRTASRACAARGLVDAAIEHACAGEDYPALEALLEQHMEELLRQGQYANILRWLEHTPADAAVSPEWLTLHAFVLTVSGKTGRAERLLRELEQRLREETDTNRAASILSGLFFLRSNLLFFTGSYEVWQTFADGLEKDMLIDNGIFYSYNFNVSEPQINRTPIGLKGALSREVEAVGLRFSQVLEAHGWTYSLFNLYVKQSLAEGYYEWGRLEDCQRLLDQIGAYGELAATPGLYVPHRILQARLYASQDQYELALAWLAQGLPAAESYPASRWSAALLAARARLLLAQEQVGPARRELGRLGLSQQELPSLDRELELLTWARLLERQHKHVQALRLLERLLPQAERDGLVCSIVEIGLLTAILEHRRGQRRAALQRVESVLRIARGHGYIRSFLDEGEAAAALLRLYVQSPDRPAADPALEDYARQLLERMRPLQPQPSELAVPDADMPSESELAMLSLIRSGASNKQIAAGLALSEGTVRVYLSRLYAKLGVSSRTQALQAAQGKGWFSS